jgi:hypothetical protein
VKARHFRPSKNHKKKDTGLLKFVKAKSTTVEIVPIEESLMRRAFTLQPGKAPKKRPKTKAEQVRQ